MKTAYLVHIDKRVKDNLPPLVLDAKQTSTVVENLINGNDEAFYLDLLTHRVPPGVDEAASITHFLNNLHQVQSQQIWKQNNLKVFGSKKSKGLKTM